MNAVDALQIAAAWAGVAIAFLLGYFSNNTARESLRTSEKAFASSEQSQKTLQRLDLLDRRIEARKAVIDARKMLDRCETVFERLQEIDTPQDYLTDAARYLGGRRVRVEAIELRLADDKVALSDEDLGQLEIDAYAEAEELKHVLEEMKEELPEGPPRWGFA